MAIVNKIEKDILAELDALGSAGCHQNIRDVFEKSFDKIVSEALKIEPVGNIIALPIITVAYIGIYGLAQMIKLDDKACLVYVNPLEIEDVISAPYGLCWALDVDDGTGTLGKAFNLAHDLIMKQKRLPLTVVGILNLGRGHVLSNHNVVATGSRSRRGGGGVADLWLSGGGPRLLWSWAGRSGAGWGSASCGSYFEI